MSAPGFTAEASLGKIRENYVPTSRTQAETGGVQPQGIWVTQWGDIIYCYDEGGFSGCTTVGHIHRFTAF
ncbi:MAG TPA: hypothetical protein VGW33_10445 [Terriglobia bacterium]|nr:hypothetical protein [Terriglobia bacterium]